jgi:cation diffusion facilitator family transporter
MNATRLGAVRRVIWITMVLNAIVAASKIAYGHYTNTLSIRADGFHSLTDATNNLVGLAGVYVASRPADAGHPYGHHKFEILASGLVGLSLLGMAYDVLKSAVERFLSSAPELPALDAFAYIVLAVTLAINIGVASYERRQGERLDSAFLLSDAVHTRSDVLVTVGVMITVALVELGYPKLDMVTAFWIAGFIAWAGIGVLRRNLSYLSDSAMVDVAEVEAVVLRVPGVASTHKVRTRGAPGSIHVDLHIQIAPHLNVVQAHRVTHWVIEALKTQIRGVTDVLVHTEPAAPDQPYNPLPDEPYS